MVVQALGVVNDLKSQNKNLSYLYMVSGQSTEGDGGGGLFWWNPVSTAPDDNVNVIQVTGVATGRWVRIDSNDSVNGTPNYMAKFVSSNGVGDSNMYFTSTGSGTEWTIGSTVGGQNNYTDLSLEAVTEGRYNIDSSSGYHAEFTNSFGNVFLLASSVSPNSHTNYILYYNGSSALNRFLAFQTNGFDRMTISHSGDVGINTSNPLAKLDINGNLRVGTIINATTDTDTFLVSDGGIIKYRTGAQLLSDIGGQPAGNYVPYVGATQNVDLGEYEIKAGQFTLDVSPTGTATVGTTRWNNDIGSSETTLKGGTVILKNGVDLVARVVNKVTPNTTLTKAQYQAVRVSGAQGQRLAVAFAQANNDNNSADTIGLVTETIPTNQEGFIITVGQLEEINTTGSLQGETWVDGDVLYLSPTTPGAITNVKPLAPQHIIVIGYVEYAHAIHGKIYVKVMNGWELGELHDVNTTGAVAGNVLKYNGTIWVPSADIDTGITSLNGLTALSQTFATGTSGTDFNISSSVSTHTFNLPTASATNRGALSSSDWTTFNNKQNALTNPVTGTGTIGTLPIWSSISGLSNSTLLEESTKFTTTKDFQADAYYLNGMTAGNGALYFGAGNRVTIENSNEGGSIYFNILNTVAVKIQENLNAIFYNQIKKNGGLSTQFLKANGDVDSTAYQPQLTLTTTGSSGASTLVGATLNIPNYTISGLGGVPTSRTLTINGTSYDLSVDRSWSVGTITSLTGEATASGSGAVAVTLTNSAVIGKVLTGLNLTGGGTIASTDTILQAFGKVQNQISALVGSVQYEGVWNASTNTPTIVSGTGSKGDYYVVNVAGSTNIDGITDWKVGDWIIFNGTTWDKVDNTDAVSSVNGFTGAVSLSTSNIAEGTNLYFTNLRAQNAITLTTSGTSGAATYTSGTLNIPAYSLSGLGGVPTTRTLTINGTAYDLSSDRSWTIPTHDAVTIGTANGLSLVGQVLSLGLASSSANGALSSIDWSTFNAKIGGTLATGQVAFGSAANTIAGSNNLFWDNANGRLGIGTNAPTKVLHVVGGDNILFQRIGSIELDLFNSSNNVYLRMSALASSVAIGTIQNYPLNLWVSGTTRAQLTATNGNLILQNGGTFTDNGQRLQVNGTALFTGSVTGTGNSSTYTVTASAGLARSKSITSTLVAAANNDVLVGLDIAPTFTNGAFTGISNYALRLSNSVSGTTVWNIWSGGTAPIYFAGDVGIGTSNVGNVKVEISDVKQTGLRYTRTDGASSDARVNLTSGTSAFIIQQFGQSHATTANLTNLSSVSGALQLSSSSVAFLRGFTNGNVLIQNGGTFTDGGQRLQVQGDAFIKGSGNTSATTALTVQNSSGDNMLSVRNDQFVSIGTLGGTPTLSFGGSVNTVIFRDSSSFALTFRNTFSNSTIFNFVTNSNLPNANTSGTNVFMNMGIGFAPTSGTGTWIQMNLAPTINQTGGANGITRGLYVNPTLSAAADWRSIEWSNNTGFGLFGSGNAPNYLNGSLGLGNISLSTVAFRNFLSYDATRTTGILNDATITVNALGINSYISQLRIAASIAVTNFIHFQATQISIGAGATISNQIGFLANSALTSATNNFGFYGDIPSGTGRWNLYMNGTANNYMAGSLGIGSTSLGGNTLRIDKNITGATTYFGIRQSPTIQSDVTSAFIFYGTETKTVAASFTITDVIYFQSSQGALGAGSSITNQYGFRANSNLTGATNNYGFYGDIASNTGRWNLYMSGTAANYLNGNTIIGGSAVDGGQKLQVNGTSVFSDTVTGARFVPTSSTVPTNGMYLGAANTLSFATNTTHRYSITSNGTFIGGITTPRNNFNASSVGSKFQLEGLSFDDCNYSCVRNSNDNGATSLKFGKTRGTTVLSNNIVQDADTLGIIQFQGADGSNLVNGAEIRGFVDGTPATQAMPGALAFATNGVGNATTERMRITSSGNVGIGTTSPTSRLQSNNASTYNSSTPSGAIIASNLSGGNAIIDIGVDSSFLGYIQSRNILNTTSYNLLLNPIGGNVGIGTTSPSERLTVANTGESIIKVQDLDGTNQFLHLGHNGGDSYFLTRNGTANGNFMWYTSDGTTTSERMRLDASGNLLVGNTSTALGERLNVTGFGIAVERVDGGSTLLMGHFGGNDGIVGMYTNNNLIFKTYDTERARITSGGNLLVGTSADSGYKLDVNGTSRIIGNASDGSGIVTIGSANSIGAIVGRYNDSTSIWQIRSYGGPVRFGTDNYSSLQFYTDGITNVRMHVDVAGNVGIGTTGPSSKLDVVGGNGDGIQYRTSTRAVGIGQISSEASVYWGSGTPLTFFAGSELMRITSSGSVGIGTSSPTELLNILGTGDTKLLVETTKVGVDANAALTLKTASDGHWNIQAGNAVSGGLRYVQIGFGERMRLDASGRLSIGNTSVSAINERLNVTGNGIAIEDSDGGREMLLGHFGGADGILGTFTNDALQIRTNNTARLTIATTGAATFSSSVTAAGLNLNNGDTFINVTSTLRGLQFGYAGPSHGSYRAAVMGGAESYGVSDSGMLTFHTQNGYVVSAIPPERMRITSGGNLLVGTTTDSGYKLDVSGTGRFSGDVRVGLGNALESLLIINGQTYSGLRFERAGTTKWAIFNNNAGTDFIDFYSYTTNTSLFKIAPTGAATFSSGVTAGGSIELTSTANTVFTNKIAVVSSAADMLINASSASMIFNAAGAERMRLITGSGNLLVGTTSDSGQKFQVNGNSLFNGIYSAGGTVSIMTWQRNGGAVAADMLYNDANTSMNFGTTTAHSLNIKTNNTTALSIASTGAATFSSTIQTAAPTGYTAQPWKLGDATSGTITPNYYIKVEINGQIYSIPALQGTP